MRTLLRAALPLLLLAGCTSGSGPIRIGLAGPFEDPVGRPMLLAARMAVAELNAQGGVGGRPLELIERDDRGNSDSALVVAESLYASDAVAVVGHLYSDQTIAAAPVYNGGAAPIAAVSPSSSSPEVRALGPYTFRVCPSDLDHGRALARWAYEGLGLRRGTLFYQNDPYGRGIRQTFAQEFARLGGSVLQNNPYLGDASDVGPYLDRLTKHGLAQFMLAAAGTRIEAETLLRQARARDIRVPLLGGDGIEGIESAGAIAEGTYQSSAYLPQVHSPANERFVAAWRERYPDAGLPNQPAAATYDAVRLLAQVIHEAGTGRRAVRDGLAQHGPAQPFEGVTGRIAFDSLGDVPSRTVYIAVVRDGRLQIAGQR